MRKRQRACWRSSHTLPALYEMKVQWPTRQSSHLRDARRHAGAAPGDKEPEPLPSPQPHAASSCTASRLPRGHGQRPLRSQRPQHPTGIIYHDSRRQSKKPRTKQAHISTIPTPAERERQAVLHTSPDRAADGASRSSATSLPGSAAGPLPGGRQATDTRPREPAADQRPTQGVGGTPQTAPPTSGAQ